MRTKIYYIFLFIIWIFSSCTEEKTIRDDTGKCEFYKIKIEKHDYIFNNSEVSHSGSCKQCKLEIDSIIRNIIKEEIGNK